MCAEIPAIIANVRAARRFPPRPPHRQPRAQFRSRPQTHPAPGSGSSRGAGGSASAGARGSTGTVYGSSTPGTVVVNTASLKLRSGPGATYSSPRSYPQGTVLTYLGKSANGLWVHVSRSGVTGWLLAQYVIVR